MSNINPFGPNFSKTKSITVGATTSGVTLDATDVSSEQLNGQTVGGHGVMRLCNIGTGIAFVRWGVGAQTAVVTDMPINGNQEILVSKPYNVDTVAAINATGASVLYITCGDGGL